VSGAKTVFRSTKIAGITMRWQLILITLCSSWMFWGCSSFKPETYDGPQWEEIPGTPQEKSEYIRKHGGLI
jgi:hypothetical protein